MYVKCQADCAQQVGAYTQLMMARVAHWLRPYVCVVISLLCAAGSTPKTGEYKYSLLMHCIKIKIPAKFLLNAQYVFVGGNISFLCVLSCSSEEDSQLDYELNGL